MKLHSSVKGMIIHWENNRHFVVKIIIYLLDKEQIMNDEKKVNNVSLV